MLSPGFLHTANTCAVTIDAAASSVLQDIRTLPGIHHQALEHGLTDRIRCSQKLLVNLLFRQHDPNSFMLAGRACRYVRAFGQVVQRLRTLIAEDSRFVVAIMEVDPQLLYALVGCHASLSQYGVREDRPLQTSSAEEMSELWAVFANQYPEESMKVLRKQRPNFWNRKRQWNADGPGDAAVLELESRVINDTDAFETRLPKRSRGADNVSAFVLQKEVKNDHTVATIVFLKSQTCNVRVHGLFAEAAIVTLDKQLTHPMTQCCVCLPRTEDGMEECCISATIEDELQTIRFCI